MSLSGLPPIRRFVAIVVFMLRFSVFYFGILFRYSISVFYCSIFSQPVGTTGVESTNFHWVFELRSANLSLKLDPHFFNVRSKWDLQPSGKAEERLENDRNSLSDHVRKRQEWFFRRQHELKHRICDFSSTVCYIMDCLNYK